MESENDGGSVVQRTTEYSPGTWGAANEKDQFLSTGESLTTTEEVIFLEPGDEKAQNIVKAMSHQNAGDVVQLLSQEGPLRLSDISERMHISMNAAKYHIENLKNAGILEVSDTRYSVKGKLIKIYRLKNQVFIVAPKMTSVSQVRSALMKYSAALVVFVCVFGVSSIAGSVPKEVIQVFQGSLGPEGMTVILSNTGIITSLITATAVTLLLLVIYQVCTNRESRKFCT
ncbi:MAG: helix-turn-helix domain-containing protein [Methanoregula sp.]|nr:helix-turn-helix domain-containing protein [Methanoregula sp.]